MRPPFAGHRTWRWRDDPEDADRYRAVETTDRGLRFFEWSHLPGDGLVREAHQSFDDFARDGPAWPLPAHIERPLRAWIASRSDETDR